MLKHLLHLGLYTIVVLVVIILCGSLQFWQYEQKYIDPVERYGYLGASILYLFRFLPLLFLPQLFTNVIGLVIFNAFPDKSPLKGLPLMAPSLCIRVVTRGNFPNLVKANVVRNINTCLDAGLENFMVEVVTDKAIHLEKHARVREIVVPTLYRTKTGALFKARALQYCLEDDVNVLNDLDWIVHLDEETILTKSCLHGILNFIHDGKYQFGQGAVTYANEEVANWLTTLADSIRVADDYFKLKFQLRVLHKPLFGWKGSYIVSQAGAERKVSFDHGIEGSITEDMFFGLTAISQGYQFDYIEGEMWEKSPFTLLDFLRQRRRWMQGLYLVVHSHSIPFRTRFFIRISLYAWMCMPFSTSNIVLSSLYPLGQLHFIDIIMQFAMATIIYMYIFGVIKSISFYKYGVIKFTLCLIGALLAIPANLVIENLAVIWGFFGTKDQFYIVKKEIKSIIEV